MHFLTSRNDAPVSVVPSAGVIVGWRLNAGSDGGGVTLRVLRPASGGYIGAGSSAVQQVTGAGINSYSARLPVQAGDVIALDFQVDAIYFAEEPGSYISVFRPPLANGGQPRLPDDSDPDRRLLLEATLEADSDGDGFGDETQDGCPQDPLRQSPPCGDQNPPPPPPPTDNVPPETTITLGPSRVRIVDRTPTFQFTANEAGVRFQCRVDRSPFRDCASPFTTRPLDLGAHRFAVRAIDGAGNFETSPSISFFGALLRKNAPECANVPVTIWVTPAAGLVLGTEGRDVIVGSEQADEIDGLGGNDRICGANKGDELIGGEGVDAIFGGTTKYRGLNPPNSIDDRISGGPGSDKLFGGNLRDLMLGEAGNDLMDGGNASDFMFGFEENSAAALERNRMRGGNGRDFIFGADGADRLNGGPDGDFINAFGGSERIFGEEGPDQISGGLGSDSLIGGPGADNFYEVSGDPLAFYDKNKLYGGPGNDVLRAGSTGDRLFGDDGDDALIGGGSLDIMEGGDGNDRMDGGGWIDDMQGGNGNDVMEAGSPGIFFPGSGGDRMLGGPGNDSLVGTEGIDNLMPGVGDDRVQAGAAGDTVRGDAGDDSILGGPGDDYLVGDEGDDHIRGEDDQDLIAGGFGNDRLNGNKRFRQRVRERRQRHRDRRPRRRRPIWRRRQRPLRAPFRCRL